MNELKSLTKKLNYLEKQAILWRARAHYLRRRPRLIPLYGTFAAGPVLFFLANPA